MLQIVLKSLINTVLSCFLVLLLSCNEDGSINKGNTTELLSYYNPAGITWKDVRQDAEEQENSEEDSIDQPNTEIIISEFAGPDLVPSPSTIAVAATGEVFVGVDRMGSLGKEPGKGSIVKLIDSNNDGNIDHHTEFAKVDNPRGISINGDQVFVLHTTFSEESGKASGMDLVVFEDKDRNGIADGPSKPIIQNISSPEFLKSRGTDHATNGIRMGIDGWIYIAVGDFGFHNAVDRTGKKLTMLGGGIVRVRPDGTEMEIYTHGTRNNYDIAIDPFMNIFTRGNTNDGGGWNIRFIHHIQSAEYGYPNLFKNFTDEILPALVDVGGGSGTGALFIDDDTWPAKYNHVPLMADWGRSQLYIHRVKPDGASFIQKEEEFIELPQITDLDIDGSGRMYLSAWDGAGYSGSDGKGFVVKAVPRDWEYKPFPDLEKASVEELIALLKASNAVARLNAQQELLNRSGEKLTERVWKIALDENLPLEVRVAGIYTYSQAAGKSGIDKLIKLTSDRSVREFALRALADRKPYVEEIPMQPFIEGLSDPLERVQVAAIIGLGRLGRKEAAKHLLKIEVPPSLKAPDRGTEGPHAIPNSSIIPAHLAVRSLVNLNAVDAVIDAVNSENSRLALWSLRYMHDPKAVNGLISAYERTDNEALKKEILNTLSRLYKKEAPYDGSWWWGTRPDTHGPVYKGIDWESSSKIEVFLKEEWEKSSSSGKDFFALLNSKHRMGIAAFGEEIVDEEKEELKVDLENIRNQEGQVGKASIEDVLLAMQELEGDSEKGKAIFKNQGCVACHSMGTDEVMKGPFMGQIGSIMSREQIAESILKPNASISQGFATYLIKTKGGESYSGFISKESANEIEIRNIVGEKFTLKTSDIISRERLENSMMPSGLVNALSYEEFASLLSYLAEQKE